jgi:hypothetical protein
MTESLADRARKAAEERLIEQEQESHNMSAPTVAGLIERLREWPDDTKVYLLDQEWRHGKKGHILEPFDVLKYPNDNYPNRCVIAAYSYDESDDEERNDGD